MTQARLARSRISSSWFPMRRVDVRGVESCARVCSLLRRLLSSGISVLRGGHILVFFGPASAWQKRPGLKERRVQDGCLIRISNFAPGPHGLEKVPKRTVSSENHYNLGGQGGASHKRPMLQRGSFFTAEPVDSLRGT